MIALLIALCAQTEGADLLVTIAAEGQLVRTQPTALILTAENSGTGALDDVELQLEVNSDEASIGVTPGCEESDDGQTQTVVCFVGSMQRSTAVSLEMNIVPNEEGDLRVTLHGTTSTVGEDPSDNTIVGVFGVNPFVPPPPDDDDDGGGCTSSGTGSVLALAALTARRMRRRTDAQRGGRV